MKKNQYLTLGGALLTGLTGLSGTAAAQSTMTMYGVVDAAMTYSSNQNGASNVYMRSGNQQSSRLGFRGTEDLGNGSQVVYVLEAGFNLDDGTSSQSGSLFNRQAYVGLSDEKAGTLTVGRQYTTYYMFVGPVGQVGAVTGATGAHPGDYDGLDVTVRSNNAVSYVSPTWSGLQFGASVAAGEQAGHTGSGGTLSGAMRYVDDRLKVSLGYQLLKNGPTQTVWDPTASTSFGKSAVNNGYLSSESIQYVALAARYQLNAFTLGGVLSGVQYHPNAQSLFRDTATLNTVNPFLLYQTSTPWLLSASYSYTKASSANGITNTANYRQLSLEQIYRLSKRTVLYLTEADQKARGQTLGANGTSVVNAVAVVGDSQTGTPSSTPNQHVFMAGISHVF